MNFPNRTCWTPLHKAAYDGFADVVHLLLDHGADVNAKTMGRLTALLFASYYNHVDVVKVLLERGANVHERNEYGRTPFQIAQEVGNSEVIRLLSGHRAHSVVDY
jgi:ankyrin repeat protein